MIRPYQRSDEGFVFSSWIQSYRDVHSDWDHETYYPYQRAMIRDLLRRSECAVADDNGLLLGWACVERQEQTCVVHYTVVKKPWQGDGMCRQLIDTAREVLSSTDNDRLVYTHRRRPHSDALEAMGFEYAPVFLGRKEW